MGCHFHLHRIFPNPGIKPGSPALQADALPSEPPGKPHAMGHDQKILKEKNQVSEVLAADVTFSTKSISPTVDNTI